MSDTWTLYCSSICFSSVLKRLVYGHYRKIRRKIGQETEKKIICEGPPLKKDGIKYITRRSPQILNTGTYREIFGDFSLAQMGDCMGIFNRPSDFSLAMGDWASWSLYPCDCKFLWERTIGQIMLKCFKTKDVNECSNIRIPFEYSNMISEFEYSHFLSVHALCFF